MGGGGGSKVKSDVKTRRERGKGEGRYIQGTRYWELVKVHSEAMCEKREGEKEQREGEKERQVGLKKRKKS